MQLLLNCNFIMICVLYFVWSSVIQSNDSYHLQNEKIFNATIDSTNYNTEEIIIPQNTSQRISEKNIAEFNNGSTVPLMSRFDDCAQTNENMQFFSSSATKDKISFQTENFESNYNTFKYNFDFYDRNNSFYTHLYSDMPDLVQNQTIFQKVTNLAMVDATQTEYPKSTLTSYSNFVDSEFQLPILEFNSDGKDSKLNETQFFNDKFHSSSSNIEQRVNNFPLNQNFTHELHDLSSNLPFMQQNISVMGLCNQDLHTREDISMHQFQGLQTNDLIKFTPIQKNTSICLMPQNTSHNSFLFASKRPKNENRKRKFDRKESMVDQYNFKTLSQENIALQNYNILQKKDTIDYASFSTSETIIFHRLLANILVRNTYVNDVCKSLKYDVDFSVLTSGKFNQNIRSSLSDAVINLESFAQKKNIKMNSLDFKCMKYSGFCAFCHDDTCLSSSNSFVSSFDYSNQLKEVISMHSDSLIRNSIISMMNDTEKYYKEMDSLNLSDFSFHVRKQQKRLLNIIDQMQTFRIFTSNGIKLETITDLFHHFQCNHLEIKLSLLPEFFSLIFQLKNKNMTTLSKRSSAIFISLYFYLRTFNLFFDFIHRTQSLQSWKQESTEIMYEKKLSTLILLLRLNFMEPFIILLTKSEKILMRYRFIIFSIFELEIRKIDTPNSQKNFEWDLFKTMIWVACCNIEKLHLLRQFSHYISTGSINYFIMNHNTTFDEFAFIFRKFENYRPKLISNEQIRDFEYLKNILIYCVKDPSAFTD